MFRYIIAFFFAVLLTTPMAMAQQTMSKQEQRAAKKAELAKERHQNYQAILQLLDERRFVIEVESFVDRYGQTLPVNLTTNFVAVSDSLATLQLAFPGNAVGYNGLGGITVEGMVTSLEILEKKPQKTVAFRLRVFGNGFASADMFVDVSTHDGRANIRYTGLRGERFTLRGYFKDLDASTIFKGTTLF